VLLVPLFWILGDAPRELSTCDGKQCQRDNLKYETSQHDVLSRIALTRGIRSCCNPPTSALKHKANEVEGAEDCGIGARFETREGLAIDDDDPRKAEVDLMTWSVLRI
jgi:hypothetical protein